VRILARREGASGWCKGGEGHGVAM
jgi:hypothetical protein